MTHPHRMSSRRAGALGAALAAMAVTVAWPLVARADPDDIDEEVHEDLGASAEEVSWGVGARLRYVFFPRGLLEQFVSKAPSGVSSPGFGLEAVRRKGNFAIHIGLEHESVQPREGYWEDKDGDVDFIDYPDGLRWTTLDVTFVFHHPLHEMVALRYGAGLGIGLIHGDARQTDATCSGSNIQTDCMPVPSRVPGGDFYDDVGLPPVFPVVNLLAGLQFRPLDELAINLEGGMRTFFFFGVSSTYFF